MVDSELVGIGAEAATGLADLGVVPKAGREGEEAKPDPGAEPRRAPRPVALEPELALAGPKHRLDPLANAAQRAEAWALVAAVGPQEGGAAIGDPALELLTGKALVGDEEVAGEWDPLEHLACDPTLGSVRRRQLEGDRGAVGGAEQIEAKAPEVAGVASAVAVAGEAGELASADG